MEKKSKLIHSCLILHLFLQDILENESINLDWMFRYSLINDIVKVGDRRTKQYENSPKASSVLCEVLVTKTVLQT